MLNLNQKTVWWVLFFKSIFILHHWRTWVLALYLPMRFIGMIGHIYIGWIATDETVAHPCIRFGHIDKDGNVVQPKQFNEKKDN